MPERLRLVRERLALERLDPLREELDFPDVLRDVLREDAERELLEPPLRERLEPPLRELLLELVLRP